IRNKRFTVGSTLVVPIDLAVVRVALSDVYAACAVDRRVNRSGDGGGRGVRLIPAPKDGVRVEETHHYLIVHAERQCRRYRRKGGSDRVVTHTYDVLGSILRDKDLTKAIDSDNAR